MKLGASYKERIIFTSAGLCSVFGYQVIWHTLVLACFFGIKLKKELLNKEESHGGRRWSSFFAAILISDQPKLGLKIA